MLGWSKGPGLGRGGWVRGGSKHSQLLCQAASAARGRRVFGPEVNFAGSPSWSSGAWGDTGASSQRCSFTQLLPGSLKQILTEHTLVTQHTRYSTVDGGGPVPSQRVSRVPKSSPYMAQGQLPRRCSQCVDRQDQLMPVWDQDQGAFVLQVCPAESLGESPKAKGKSRLFHDASLQMAC